MSRDQKLAVKMFNLLVDLAANRHAARKATAAANRLRREIELLHKTGKFRGWKLGYTKKTKIHVEDYWRERYFYVRKCKE